MEGIMSEFDDELLEYFLENQLQLFPEPVAETLEEAKAFLEDSLAVVVESEREIIEYFEDEGVDLEDADENDVLDFPEVFDIGDGRFLIVEG